MNKEEIMQELVAEQDTLLNLPDEEGVLRDLPARLLRNQEEERLVEEFLHGRRDMSLNCVNACKTKPTGWYCLVVCGGGDNDDRRLDDSDKEDSQIASSGNGLRGRRDREEVLEELAYGGDEEPVSCLDFPMEVPDLIQRIEENSPGLQNCQLDVDCVILRKCSEGRR
jgi:hypothetical protein